MSPLDDIRGESCLDPRVPLGVPAAGRPERGQPSVAEYFAEKHKRGEMGEYYGLHHVARSYGGKRCHAS